MHKKALILGLIILIGSATALYFNAMTLYMGLFFIIFSAFKLLDVKGFAKGFQKYDLIAKRSKVYALAYPFIELLLGILFLSGMYISIASTITLIIMSVGAVGVFLAIRKKQAFTCACLGTRLGIPLTYVTLFENLVMVAMALWILL